MQDIVRLVEVRQGFARQGMAGKVRPVPERHRPARRGTVWCAVVGKGMAGVERLSVVRPVMVRLGRHGKSLLSKARQR